MRTFFARGGAKALEEQARRLVDGRELGQIARMRSRRAEYEA